jgi:hypothetical protein
VEVVASSLIDEPVELREEMLALAAVAPGQVRSRLVNEMAAIALERMALCDGEPERFVEAACRSYERELWLWLVGERRWQQCAEGLSGRLARRNRAYEARSGVS